LLANRKTSPFSYRRAAAIGGNHETGGDPLMALPVNNHSRFDAALDVRNTNSAAHFRACVFGNCKQCFLHNLVWEGKQR
jgi:hypothetical protein